MLSEHVLPEALQRGAARQRGLREASMSRHAPPYALLCSLPRQRSGTTPGYFLGEAAFWPASTAFCETLLPNGLNIRMQFFIRIFDKVL